MTLKKMRIVAAAAIVGGMMLAYGPKAYAVSTIMPGVERTNYVFKTVDDDTLLFDVFVADNVRPAMGGEKRPVLFYNFGGGWQAGDRLWPTSERFNLLPWFASQGWIVVCHDYRLGFLRARQQGVIPERDIVEYLIGGGMDDPAVWNAVQSSIDLALDDTVDAIRFLDSHADEWGADMNCIVGCGGSAGGINLATLEYMMCSGSRPDITDRLPEGFKFSALIPMAGGVWVTGTEPLEWRQRPCPMIMFHGDADPIVPYGEVLYGNSHGAMHGSSDVARQLRDMNVPYVMYTVTGGDHNWSNAPVVFHREDMTRWIERIVGRGEHLQIDVVQTCSDPNRIPE